MFSVGRVTSPLIVGSPEGSLHGTAGRTCVLLANMPSCDTGSPPRHGQEFVIVAVARTWVEPY